MFLLNDVIGGSMSSRLFQEIRERQGLVYSIHSGAQAFADTGLLYVYAATDAQNFAKVLKSTLKELRDLKKNGVTVEELKLAKDHLMHRFSRGSRRPAAEPPGQADCTSAVPDIAEMCLDRGVSSRVHTSSGVLDEDRLALTTRPLDRRNLPPSSALAPSAPLPPARPAGASLRRFALSVGVIGTVTRPHGVSERGAKYQRGSVEVGCGRYAAAAYPADAPARPGPVAIDPSSTPAPGQPSDRAVSAPGAPRRRMRFVHIGPPPTTSVTRHRPAASRRGLPSDRRPGGSAGRPPPLALRYRDTLYRPQHRCTRATTFVLKCRVYVEAGANEGCGGRGKLSRRKLSGGAKLATSSPNRGKVLPRARAPVEPVHQIVRATGIRVLAALPSAAPRWRRSAWRSMDCGAPRFLRPGPFGEGRRARGRRTSATRSWPSASAVWPPLGSNAVAPSRTARCGTSGTAPLLVGRVILPDSTICSTTMLDFTTSHRGARRDPAAWREPRGSHGHILLPARAAQRTESLGRRLPTTGSAHAAPRGRSGGHAARSAGLRPRRDRALSRRLKACFYPAWSSARRRIFLRAGCGRMKVRVSSPQAVHPRVQGAAVQRALADSASVTSAAAGRKAVEVDVDAPTRPGRGACGLEVPAPARHRCSMTTRSSGTGDALPHQRVP